MHCLYCDRPLALLKRLTGDGEFCSKEHRKIYQQEHNQLALARLLESQPKAKGKPRADKTEDVKPQPETIEVESTPQPKLAGFMPEHLDAGPVPGARRLAGAPQFKQGNPVWGGLRDRPGPGPKAAGFLAASRPSYAAGTAQSRSKLDFKPPVGKLLLDQNRREALRRPQPAGAGFVSEQPAGRLSVGTARPPAGARFSPLTPVTTRTAGALWSGRDCQLRTAKFFAGAALQPTGSASMRVPAIQTRWKPLSQALPAQTHGRIIVVLGTFLERPVRPASQDLPPETFEIPFLPIYPQYSPRMGCLEERLHRTDRIGFSPP
jgi:hypothetical protein